VNDQDQAVLDGSMGAWERSRPPGILRQARLVPPGVRITAYWYSARRGLPTAMCCLLELGLRAAHMARQAGYATVRVTEGPFLVNTWPEEFWDAAAATMDWRWTAWQYAAGARMLAGDDSDAEFVSCLDRYGTELAVRCGLPRRPGPDGETWPDWIWGRTADAMANRAAEYGDWLLYDIDLDELLHGSACEIYRQPVPRGDPEHPHGYWEAGDY
jgi:hypothetical protein